MYLFKPFDKTCLIAGLLSYELRDYFRIFMCVKTGTLSWRAGLQKHLSKTLCLTLWKASGKVFLTLIWRYFMKSKILRRHTITSRRRFSPFKGYILRILSYDSQKGDLKQNIKNTWIRFGLSQPVYEADP